MILGKNIRKSEPHGATGLITVTVKSQEQASVSERNVSLILPRDQPSDLSIYIVEIPYTVNSDRGLQGLGASDP